MMNKNKWISLFSFLGVVTVLTTLFLNCSGNPADTGGDSGGISTGAGAGTGPNFSLLKPSCFNFNSQPQIKSGDYFSGSNWNDPHVLKVGSQYWMYASSGTVGGDVVIYRFVSSSLSAAWQLSPSTPVFVKAAGGSDWDRHSVETPSVVQFQGKFYMFYTGFSNQTDVSTYKVGYATSLDGISWTRVPGVYLEPTNPLGAPNFQFNQYTVAEPGAVVFNNKIYLYFTAVGANVSVGTTLQTIGLVTSTDGVSWTAAQQVLLPDQSLYPRPAHWVGYSTPHGAVLNGQMHLFFDVANDATSWEQQRLHHAVSADGITNWVQDSAATLDITKFSWASREVRAPAVFLDGTTLHYWFGADQGSVLAIGKGTCSL